MPPRLFTVAEARAALPEVRSHVEQLLVHRAGQLAASARIAELTAASAGNGHGLDGDAVRAARQELDRAESGIAETLTALDELGVVVKDVDGGLVDFPSLRDGEEVFLCWHSGEPELDWWHGADEGFAGRKPI